MSFFLKNTTCTLMLLLTNKEDRKQDYLKNRRFPPSGAGLAGGNRRT